MRLAWNHQRGIQFEGIRQGKLVEQTFSESGCWRIKQASLLVLAEAKTSIAA